MDSQATADDAAVIVALPAVVDLANAGQVYDRLSAAVRSGTPVVIADLSATTFCDATGVHRLVMVCHQAAARGGRLRLVVPPGALLRRTLVLLGVDHLLPVYVSVAEAGNPPAGPQHPLSSRL